MWGLTNIYSHIMSYWGLDLWYNCCWLCTTMSAERWKACQCYSTKHGFALWGNKIFLFPLGSTGITHYSILLNSVRNIFSCTTFLMPQRVIVGVARKKFPFRLFLTQLLETEIQFSDFCLRIMKKASSDFGWWNFHWVCCFNFLIHRTQTPKKKRRRKTAKKTTREESKSWRKNRFHLREFVERSDRSLFDFDLLMSLAIHFSSFDLSSPALKSSRMRAHRIAKLDPLKWSFRPII